MAPARTRTMPHPGAATTWPQPRTTLRRITLGDWRTFLRWQWIVTFAIVATVASAVVCTQFKVYIATGDGNSMYPTLRDGGHEFLVGWKEIKSAEGKIYAFKDFNGELCIKRAARVIDNKVWFLGDNQGQDRNGRPESVDSREYGWIPTNRILALHVLSIPHFFDGSTVARDASTPAPISQSNLNKRAKKAQLLSILRQKRLAELKERGLIEAGPVAIRDCNENTDVAVYPERTLDIKSPETFHSIRWVIDEGAPCGLSQPTTVRLRVDGKDITLSTAERKGTTRCSGRHVVLTSQKAVSVKEFNLFH